MVFHKRISEARRKPDKQVKEQAGLIRDDQKLPCGSSRFSGKLSLHDSFSIGLIMLSSKGRQVKRKSGKKSVTGKQRNKTS